MRLRALPIALAFAAISSSALKIPFRQAKRSPVQRRSGAAGVSVSRPGAGLADTNVLAATSGGSNDNTNAFDVKCVYYANSHIGRGLLKCLNIVPSMIWFILLMWVVISDVKDIEGLNMFPDHPWRQRVSCSTGYWLKWLVGRRAIHSFTQFQPDIDNTEPHCEITSHVDTLLVLSNARLVSMG